MAEMNITIELDNSAMQNEVSPTGIDRFEVSRVLGDIRRWVLEGERMYPPKTFNDRNGNRVATVKIDLNVCDYCGGTIQEVRRLPIGGDSTIFVCQEHYRAQLEYWEEAGEDLSDVPRWQDLPRQD